MSEIKEVAQVAYRVFPRMTARAPQQHTSSDDTPTSLAERIQQAAAAAPLAEPIRISGPGRPWTVDDLLALTGVEGRYELVRGDLVMMSPASPTQGRYAARLVAALEQYLEAHDLGETYTAEPGFELQPEPNPIVRAPDVAFLRHENIPSPGRQTGFWSVAPDLAIEIISPSETSHMVQEKVQDYLKAGTAMIWLVYPDLQVIVEYRSRTKIRQLTLDENLDGDDVLPGFSYPLRRLFR
jgi:Uma2 family endonuclease